MVKINLQFFGGRGGESGVITYERDGVKFRVLEHEKENMSIETLTKAQSPKWDYRGYRQQTDKIENAVNNAQTRNDVQKAYRAINEHEKNLTAELNRNDSTGDQNVLLTEQRRTRQLKQKFIKKGIL